MSHDLRPLRSLIAMLRRPQLRSAIAEVLAGDAPSDDGALLANVAKIGFVEADGGGYRVNEQFLNASLEALDTELGPLAVLGGERIVVGDLRRNEVDAVVASVARRVLDPGEQITEGALNERLHMFVVDVAFFRRRAVDTGVVARTADGLRYWRP